MIYILVLALLIIFIINHPVFGKVPPKQVYEHYQKRASNFKDGMFLNEVSNKMMTSYSSQKGTQIKPAKTIQVKDFQLPENNEWVWLGHSSLVFKKENQTFLFDPVFSERCSPFSFLGPKRYNDLKLSSKDFNQIDYCLISHDHYDHLDYRTIKDIDKKVKCYIVPLGVDYHLIRFGVSKNKIKTFAWNESFEFNGFTLKMIPSVHFSGRMLKRNTALWGGYLLKFHDLSIYFSGDGGYGPHFKTLVDQVDYCFLECGQYNDRWPDVHLRIQDGLKAIEDIKPKYTIPIHHGSFVLSTHDYDEPIKLLKHPNYEVLTTAINQINKFHIQSHKPN